MKTRNLLLTLAALVTFSSARLSASEPEANFGVVNFATCITESKYGKFEQKNLDSIQKQMSSMIEDTEKQLREISSKFEDSEFLDSLSPKAEEELLLKKQALEEDLNRYHSQRYQILQQANYQLFHRISASITKASEAVAKNNKLGFVVNKEACFYYSPKTEVTQLVIDEMDKNFEVDKKQGRISENNEANIPNLANSDTQGENSKENLK